MQVLNYYPILTAEIQQVVDCLLDSPFHPFLEIFRPSLMTKNHARSPLRIDTESLEFFMKP
ncbi:hypothetical protein DPEC_G00111060 [Dallia pectoralis]|uniref:Uncharacterized protein n=1 Tax=Dallia pectoralis TaxID=75939 RepID=A0ACC2GTA3_DALPE|nr:hypothetical protein DPEC_G00111060 [Dallia pectoralis]